VSRIRWRDDRGQVGGIEVLPFGVLVFVIGSLVVTSAWAVVDAKLMVDAAAREAVRAYVEAPDEPAAEAAATRAADETVTGYGRRADRLALAMDHEGGQPFARCVRVTVDARYPVPAVRLPWIGGVAGSVTVHARHTERIDPFRSGLTGSGPC
jgi:hypothetical protein